MADTKIEFLYLNEEDMIHAGVLNAGRCVDVMGEVMSLLSTGDVLMGGKGHNDHGIQLMFPKNRILRIFRWRIPETGGLWQCPHMSEGVFIWRERNGTALTDEIPQRGFPVQF